MNPTNSVGILTTRNHPLLAYFLDEVAQSAGAFEPFLIFDRKDFQAKDARIFAERTRGAFPRRDI